MKTNRILSFVFAAIAIFCVIMSIIGFPESIGYPGLAVITGYVAISYHKKYKNEKNGIVKPKSSLILTILAVGIIALIISVVYFILCTIALNADFFNEYGRFSIDILLMNLFGLV